jgi:predicted RNA-binding Zn ribbon-like protein
MDGYFVEPASLEDVVEFVNAWSPAALEAAETTASSPEIAEARRHHRLPDAEVAEQERLATRLHQVFLGDTPEERRESLNALIAEVSLAPTVGPAGHGWLLGDEAGVGAAALVLGLWDHAGTDPELERLGTCAGDRCVDAFHDSTQAHTRRFCSLKCQNRAKVAAYRRRQAATAS